MRFSSKVPTKSLVAQQDESDCGVACLASIIAFHKGNVSLERLRELSGTTTRGTTLAGLREAARKLDFEAEGMKADSAANLKEALHGPVILHTTIRDITGEYQLEHYVVCYGWNAAQQHFVIGDPARGITNFTPTELEAVWPSRVLLTLVPNAAFVTCANSNLQKRQWLLNTLRGDIQLLLLATVLGVATAALSLSTAIFSQKLIDKILPSHDTKRLWAGLALLSFLLVARALLTYLRTGLLNKQNRDFNNRLIDNFFGKLLYLPKSFFDNRKTGELVARLSDTSRIQRTITYLAGSFVINAIFVLVATVYVFTYSTTIGALVLASIPIYLGITWLFTGQLMSGHRKVMAAVAINESQYIDTIRNIDSIKASGKEPFFRTVTQATYGKLQEQSFNLNQTGLRFSTLTEIAGVVLISSIICFTSYSVVVASLKLGEMVGILTIVGSIIPSVNTLALTNIQLQEASIAFERMFEYTQLKPEGVSSQTTPLPQIESLRLTAVDFRFPGHSLLLKDINLEVQKGEVIAIMGESGSGKSTLLQILQRFYPLANGNVLVNNQDWNLLPLSVWRGMIGVVSQRTTLFSDTLFNNICLGGTATEMPAFSAFCQEWGFDHYFARFPQGYNTRIGESGVALSGGQQQLVLLARALYGNPQVLLLDEPTAAMDELTEQFAMQALQKAREFAAIVIITHRPAVAECAQKVYAMRDGILQLTNQGYALA